MRLDEHDLRSALWLRLHAHLTGRLASLRAQNDGDFSPEDTSKLRGRIAELKAILALAEQEPVQMDATDEAASFPGNPQWVDFTQEHS